MNRSNELAVPYEVREYLCVFIWIAYRLIFTFQAF